MDPTFNVAPVTSIPHNHSDISPLVNPEPNTTEIETPPSVSLQPTPHVLLPHPPTPLVRRHSNRPTTRPAFF